MVQFTLSSSFTLTSATLYLQSSSLTPVPTTNPSGDNIQFSFSAVQSSTSYYFYLNTSAGKAYSNSFTVTVQQCIPTISISPSSYSYTVTSLASPYTVFTPISTNNYTSNCILSYSASSISGTSTSQYSLDSSTGAFKITTFTGYFQFANPWESHSLYISFLNLLFIQCCI